MAPAAPALETRKVILLMYTTFDGYCEFPQYPGSEPGVDQPELVGEEMWAKRWDSIDTLLYDAKSYGEWAEYWPIANRTAGEHPWIRRLSEYSERVNKVVLSSTPRPTTWAHTRFIPGDPGEALGALKKEPGANMAVVAPKLVWDSFGSWLRTIRPGIPPSEFVVANALRDLLPDFLLSSAKNGSLAKFIANRQDTTNMQGFRLAS